MKDERNRSAGARLPHVVTSALPLCLCLSLHAADMPEISAVTDAMRQCVAQQEVAGAVTIIAAPDCLLRLGAVGQADVATDRPARPDTIYWIASMTKPVTATAVLMLQDEGKLSVDAPVATYIPEFSALMTRVHSGNLKTGFTDGNGWCLGVCVVREPQGVTAALSPGSFGHWGTGVSPVRDASLRASQREASLQSPQQPSIGGLVRAPMRFDQRHSAQ